MQPYKINMYIILIILAHIIPVQFHASFTGNLATVAAQALACRSDIRKRLKSSESIEKYLKTIYTNSEHTLLDLYNTNLNTSQKHKQYDQHKIHSITEEEAYQALQDHIKDFILNSNNTETTQQCLEKIEMYSQHLTSTKYEATKAAISFVAHNSQKKNLWDIPFWLDAWYSSKANLQALPIPQEIRDMSTYQLLPILSERAKK